MNGALRLLAVFPHPDDESMGLGSTLAYYATKADVETHLVCATLLVSAAGVGLLRRIRG